MTLSTDSFVFMTNIIRDAKKSKEYYDKIFKDYFADKNFPLEQRWNIFCESSKEKVFYKCKPFIMYFDSISDAQVADGRFELYETVSLMDFVDILEEEAEDGDFNALKEEILQAGYTHFEYDW